MAELGWGAAERSDASAPGNTAQAVTKCVAKRRIYYIKESLRRSTSCKLLSLKKKLKILLKPANVQVLYSLFCSRNSVVGVATRYGLEGIQFESR
jgi:hypothetical protein